MKRKRCLQVIVAFLCISSFLLTMVPASYAIMTKATTEELTAGAKDIVVGRVLDVVPQWNADKTTIFTEVTIAVSDWLKGEGPEVVIIRVPGGRVGDVGLWVEDMPAFRKNQDVIVFLEPTDDPLIAQVKGDVQGKFTIKEGRVVGTGLPLADFAHKVKSIVQIQQKNIKEK